MLEYRLSAKGAALRLAWGSAPGNVHIIFRTKNREPWLDSGIRPRLHGYLATICRDLGGEALLVGGVADHVHIIATLLRTVSQAELIEGLKKPASKWIKAMEVRYHRSCTFQEEYRELSRRPKIEFDEQ
ncbi:MAG: hypothetical protein DME32_18030 [Verrucomicrobia bacterium]|nr:MAG: hypothetical protein DME32_18030 [Verrucomicrobiota bacterium]